MGDGLIVIRNLDDSPSHCHRCGNHSTFSNELRHFKTSNFKPPEELPYLAGIAHGPNPWSRRRIWLWAAVLSLQIPQKWGSKKQMLKTPNKFNDRTGSLKFHKIDIVSLIKCLLLTTSLMNRFTSMESPTNFSLHGSYLTSNSFPPYLRRVTPLHHLRILHLCIKNSILRSKSQFLCQDVPCT